MSRSAGHRIRLPLDVMLVATANPEDYTNRGRIITPLKDRFGAQIRTHYPFETMTEVKIMEGEAELPSSGVPVSVPPFMKEIVAEISQLARRSTHLNQRSGVSRAALHRQLRDARRLRGPPRPAHRRARRRTPGQRPRGPRRPRPRARSRSRRWRRATRRKWWPSWWPRPRCRSSAAASPSTIPQSIVGAFHDQVVVHVGDDMPSSAYLSVLADMPELEPADPQAGRPRGGRGGVAGADGERSRVPPRGPAPDEAAEQGRVGRPRPLSRPEVRPTDR